MIFIFYIRVSVSIFIFFMFDDFFGMMDFNEGILDVN